ncbi:MAG TPA: hypothetical protein VHJ99_04760 [Candidatus Dormibacteraeota bacterium]|nr:hypothetical protein [Candidatus Dormibacteraeota bacterium]
MFFTFLAATYTTSQAVAVRRLSDTATDVISFGRLLAEIEASPQTITREWWTGHFDPGWDHTMGAQNWADNFGGSIVDYVDPAVVAADFAELVAKVLPVRKYVNQYLAHTSQRPGRADATYADIDDAIDFIGRMFQRYSLLVEVADRPILVPAVTGDLMAPFRMPWLPELAFAAERAKLRER